MKCPNCGITHNQTERRPNGDTKCFECGYIAPTLEWAKHNNQHPESEKQELSHFGLCDVNGCHHEVKGSHDGSDFCSEHLSLFYPTDPVDGEKMHPLLNPASPHYSMVDGFEAIERMEQMYTTEQLMSWSIITAMKYRLRIGKKDSVEGDAVKILGYEAYYQYLQNKAEGEE